MPQHDYWLWIATRNLQRPTPAIHPIRKVYRTWTRTDSEKVEVFEKHFTEIFKLHSNNTRLNTESCCYDVCKGTQLTSPGELKSVCAYE